MSFASVFAGLSHCVGKLAAPVAQQEIVAPALGFAQSFAAVLEPWSAP